MKTEKLFSQLLNISLPFTVERVVYTEEGLCCIKKPKKMDWIHIF